MFDKKLFKAKHTETIIERYEKTDVYQIDKELILQKKRVETEKYICDLVDNHINLMKTNIGKEDFYFSSKYKNVPLSGFFNAVNFLIVEEIMSFQKKWAKKNTAHFDLNNIIELLSFNIADVIFPIISRTLVLEMNVKRVQNKLNGDSPEDRFRSFIAILKEKETRSELMQEYPILFLQVKKHLTFWNKNSSELISHLIEDWENICEKFSITNDSKITKIQIGAGDTHLSGKTVCILHFGENNKIVYKPRNLEIDEYFNDIYNWFNDRSNDLDWKNLKIINRKKYGWVEFISNLPCTSEEQLKKYHQRLGGLLFILYSLNSTDIHFENIIANGEYPVIIDLETIFNPKVKNEEPKNVRQFIANNIECSVLSTAILPWRIFLKGEFIDISGLSNVEANNPKLPTAAWQSEGEDNMSLSSTLVSMKNGGNIPRFNDIEISSSQYHKEIIEGFESCYKMVLKAKESYSKNIGRLADCEVRVLLRQTETYSTLLNNSFHPDYFRDFVTRDSLFDSLLLISKRTEHLQKIIDSEKKSLWQKDVPYFYCKSNSKTLKDTFGNCFENYFSESGFDRCLNKIHNLSIKDLEHQKWLISSSLDSYLDPKLRKHTPAKKLNNKSVTNKDTFLELSLKIFDRLKQSEFTHEGESNWVSNFQNGKKTTTKFNALHFDIYDGLAGVILFLAYLYKITKDKNVKTTFESSLKALESDVEMTDIKQFKANGVFNGGTSGLIFLYITLYDIFKDNNYLKKAQEYTKDIDINLIKDNDVLSGKAGVLLTLIKYYKITNDSLVLEKMESLVNLIIKNAVKASGGYTWKNPSGKDICGFGHGLAGIIYSLTQYYILKPSDNLKKYIKGGVVYENNFFEPDINNWKDLRDFEDDKYHGVDMTAWCNGAVGIGFSRLELTRIFPEQEMYQQDFEATLKKTFDSGFGHNHTLCHGDFGNIDFLIESINEDSKWDIATKTEVLIKKMTDYIKSNEIVYSNNTGVQNVSLMLGLSGIGYQLLRLVDSDNVPSILLLK